MKICLSREEMIKSLRELNDWLRGRDEMGDDAMEGDEAVVDPILNVKSIMNLKNYRPITSTEEGTSIVESLVDYFVHNADIKAREVLTDALKAYSSARRQSQSHPSQGSQSETPETEPEATD